MKAALLPLLLPVLSDRKVWAAALTAFLAGVGWTTSPALRDAIWTVFQAVVSAVGG